MNIQKFTQKSLEAVNGCEKLAYEFGNQEYKKEEIMELLLVNGISTTDIPNDYSGRGVGMDVINHSIKEIGGKLNITSEEGFGTKIEIEV